MKKSILAFISVLAFSMTHTVQAQICGPTDGEYVSCGSVINLDPSAIVHIDASNKGFLLPRMTETQKMAIASPATGLIVFQTDATSGFYYYNGTAWTSMSGGVNTDNQDLSLSGNTLSLTNDATTVDLSAFAGWGMTGNAGTVAGTNFLGTTDNQALVFKVNNIPSGYISNSAGSTTFFGYNAGANAPISSSNSAVGSNALTSITTGSYNEAFGVQALFSNTQGNDNKAIGYRALYNSTTANECIAIGNEALTANATGNSNIAIGHKALAQNVSGTDNIGIGSYTLNPTTGTGNVGLGRDAGNYNHGGSFNTCIGYLSNLGSAGSTQNNSIAIGYQANANASNKIRMGNGAITVAEIQVAWTVTSDKNAKKEIAYDVAGLDFINQLQPATYRYKTHDETAPRYTGLLAQDVEATLQEMGIESSIVTKPNADGTGSWGIRYAELTMPLINSVQELSKENEELKNQVSQLQAKVNEVDQLKAEISQIKAMLSQQASK